MSTALRNHHGVDDNGEPVRLNLLGDNLETYTREAAAGQRPYLEVIYVGGGLPTVTLSATDPNAAEEGQDTGTFTVSRNQTSGNLVVYYSVGGTAAAGDYEETLSGSVTIPDGQASAKTY